MKRIIENGNRAVWFSPRNRRELDEVRDCGTIEDSPGRAHPGTENRAMSGFLMMRIVMGFVRDRLRRGQTANHEKAQHEKTGK